MNITKMCKQQILILLNLVQGVAIENYQKENGCKIEIVHF